MSAAPLLPVGRDCDCGHPLVWFNDQPSCAVYGTHPATGAAYFRNYHAAASQLVTDLARLGLPAGHSRTRKADYR